MVTPELPPPEEGELVPVMVPRHLLMDVYGFMASRGLLNGTSTNSPGLHRGWTADLIVEVYRAASARMKALLDLMASRADEKLYAEDFMKELDVEKQDVVNGVLGAFARLTNQRFAPRLPDRKSTWPFTIAKDVRSHRWYYEMPESVAAVIKSIDR